MSISYNQELSVDSLTAYLLNEFSRLSGNQAADSLAQFAEELKGSDSVDFEVLLGPLESISRAIPYLSGMDSVLSGSRQLERCARMLSRFTEEVHQIGLGIVLDRIATVSHGVGDNRFEMTILKVCRRLVDAFEQINSTSRHNSDAGQLTIATLNYDGLLTAALTRLRDERVIQLSDLGDEGNQRMCTTTATLSEAYGLRQLDDLRRYSTHLLHLHGSLGWLADSDSNEAWKFSIRDLRRVSYWTEFRDGTVSLIPKVVLTDQKAKVVTDWPYMLAYQILGNRLDSSYFWFIGGYGFGDQPVNAVLERSYRKARNRPPRILIIDPDRRTEERALSVFSPNRGNRRPFDYCDAKFPEAVDTPDFNEFFR